MYVVNTLISAMTNSSVDPQTLYKISRALSSMFDKRIKIREI